MAAEHAAPKTRRYEMKNRLLNSFVRMAGVGALAALFLTLAATANAQCTGSFESITNAIALSRSTPKSARLPIDQLSVTKQDLLTSGVNTSIVGLWRIKFIIETPGGPEVFQEAFQIWNAGGTEVHNPKVDPRGGSVCLGSWIQQAPLTFKLTHRVWLYDINGNFHVIGRLTESLTLGDRGNTHSGTFTLQAVDNNDDPLGEPLVGTVEGVRISPN
jgi:hypothetical protein